MSTRHKNKLLFICTIASFLWGCATHEHKDKKIFRYNETTGIASLDPAFAKNQSIMWPVHQLYSTLLQVSTSLQIEPSVATNWSFSEDRKTITFNLRADVFFHDDICFNNGIGRKMVAADVVYSLNRILDKKTASPGAWIFNDRVEALNPFEAPNDTTFILRLSKPFFPVLGILTMQYCSILPREAVEKYGVQFRRHPVGSGPFQFVAWDEGQALVLTKNLHYFERDSLNKKLPYLDGIKVSFLDSKATEFLAFRQGKIDFLNDIDPSFKDEVLSKTGKLKSEWNQTIVLQKQPYLNVEYLGILVDSTNDVMRGNLLSHKLIRKAINFGINREKMMLYLRNSVGQPATSGFVPPGLPSFNAAEVRGYRYNPDTAKLMLARAGFANGKNLPTIKLLTIPIYANLASFIANELQQIGITVQVEAIQKSLLLQQTSKSQAPFFRGSWIADYPDAENYLSVFYGKNPAPPNYTRYKNPAFDALYEQALTETTDSLRYKLYQNMDKMIVEDAPIIPLWYDEALHLVQKNITGFETNSLNMLELRRTKK